MALWTVGATVCVITLAGTALALMADALVPKSLKPSVD
jgi:hypothetical protein